jgi:hypothetical protein
MANVARESSLARLDSLPDKCIRTARIKANPDSTIETLLARQASLAGCTPSVGRAQLHGTQTTVLVAAVDICEKPLGSWLEIGVW